MHTRNALTSEYASALENYLAGGGEQALQQAYELGRSAIYSELGIIDMAEVYHQAMLTVLRDTKPGAMDKQMKKAMIFFEESLSPFEFTHRGYQDAVGSMRRVANFAFMACHEVKAPLTAILSSASMLEEMMEADPGGLQSRLLANILSGVEILKSRAEDLLDAAGLYSGALTLRICRVHVQDFLPELFERLEPEVKSRGMRFDLRVAEILPEVEMDPDRIEQVITNLVQNAVKYASEGRWIELRAATRRDRLVITVRDRGEGLPLYEQKILLSAHLPMGRDDQAHGTGLGLIICRQIIEAHHGKIKLISKPGRGSVFELHLPVLQN